MDWKQKMWGVVALLMACGCLSLAGPGVALAADEEEAADEVEAEEQDDAQSEEAGAGAPDARMLLLSTTSLDDSISDIVTSRIDDSIRDRMGSVGRVELLASFRALYGQAGEEATQEALAEAERDYTSAIGLINAESYDEAADVLARAVTVLEENVAELSNFNVLVDALANLAIAHHHTGFDLDARDHIRQYAYLVPEDAPRYDDLPEELAELYRGEAQRVADAGPGVLRVESDRRGAEVILNGESVGRTPVDVEDVGFGEHYLVVRHGDDSHSEKVRVRGGGDVTEVEVSLRDEGEADDEDALPSFYVDLRDTLGSGVFDGSLAPYFDEVATQTGADYVAWTLLHSDPDGYAVHPFVYRQSDGKVIQGEAVVFNQQLTNLRSRSADISETLAVAVVHMPSSMAVEEVALEIEEPEEPAVVADTGEGEEEEEIDREAAAGEQIAEREPAEDTEPSPSEEPAVTLDDPGPLPDEGGWSRRRYLGIGGAAALLTAGTLFLVMSGSDGAPGFEAEVEW